MRIFSGVYKGRTIQSPKGLKTRPTSGRLRESLFNICQGYIEGTRFLDLFAGSGAMGFEALSRGAGHVTFVDNSRESIRCIKDNAQLLGVNGQVEILYGDVFEVLGKLIKKERPFDLIYADPPYAVKSKEEGGELPYSVQVLEKVDQHPRALLTSDGSLFLEDEADALSDHYMLTSLALESSRQMGRSALQQFVINSAH